MKFLILIKNNLHSLIYHNHVTFCVVVFCVMVSTFGIHFFAGYILQKQVSMVGDTREIVRIYPEKAVSSEIAFQWIKELDVFQKKVQYIIAAESEEAVEGEDLPVLGEYSVEFSRFLESGSLEAFDTSQAVALLPEDYVSCYVEEGQNPLHTTINNMETDYEVVGVLSYTPYDGILVPLFYYLKQGKTGYLQYNFQEDFSNEEKRELLRILEGFSGIAKYECEDLDNQVFTDGFLQQFGAILAIFSVVIINFFTIIVFWIAQSKVKYNIYSVCGGSKGKVWALIVSEMYLVILFSSMAGLLLFLGIKGIFTELELTAGGILFYCGIEGVMLGMILMFLMITCWHCNRNSIIHQM